MTDRQTSSAPPPPSDPDPEVVALQVIEEARAMMVGRTHTVQEIDDFLTAGLADAKALAMRLHGAQL